MPKVSPIQSNFNGGEVSPLLYGRVDVPRYKESLAKCLNYIPLIQGPKTRRPGTYFVFPVKDSTKFTRLIPFEASTAESYMVEVGNQYMRFFQNNAIVTISNQKNITGITQANTAVVTSNSHGYSNGDHIVITGVSGMTEVNNREFVVANTTTNTFELTGENSLSYGAYSSGGHFDGIYEITTCYDFDSSTSTIPYLTADIAQLQFTQSNEVLYITHPKYPPYKLALSGNPFALTRIPILDGPYLPIYAPTYGATATTLKVHDTGGAGHNKYQLIASGIDGINGNTGFQSTDVGRVVRIKHSTTWYWGRISHVTSTTGANIESIVTPSSLPPLDNLDTVWRMGLYSDTDGWPTSVAFHEDRLVFGGAGADPTRFDGSNSSDYENFAPSGTDGTIATSNSYGFSLTSNDLNPIQWLTSDEQGIIAGTRSAEWLITAADSVSALSATSVSAKKTTSFGSEYVQAVQSGKCSIFVQRGGRKVRELNYFFDVSGFRAADLTQLSEHITQSKLTFLATQKIPQPIVWGVRTDGVLLSMTYERDLDALKVGWARHTLGGTNAAVESIGVLSSADGESQDVWLIVKRTVNGQTVRYIEYITQLFDEDTDVKDAFFVDCGLTYNGSPTATISGLNHLNGETVAVWADGAAQTNKVVLGGKITLDASASIVQVGLPYNSDGQKLRSDAGSADGTAMGKTRRTHRIGIQLLNTVGIKLGPDFDTLDDLELDSTEAGVLGQSPALFTGITTQPITTDYDFDNMICWRQSQPGPGTILGLYPQQVTQDRG